MSSKRESDSEHPQGHKKADSGDSHGDHQAHQVDEVARAHDHHSQNGSSKPVLYHSLFACSTRPVVVIHELGIQDKVEIKKVKMSEAKTEAYLAMNPHGTVRYSILCFFSMCSSFFLYSFAGARQSKGQLT